MSLRLKNKSYVSLMMKVSLMSCSQLVCSRVNYTDVLSAGNIKTLKSKMYFQSKKYISQFNSLLIYYDFLNQFVNTDFRKRSSYCCVYYNRL